MDSQKRAGTLWIADLAGAALFAWGIADGVSRAADGHSPGMAAAAAMLAGGAVRAGIAWAVPALAISGAQAAGTALRAALFRRLLGRGEAPSIGHAATLAIDHVTTIENYEARFVPARVSAAAGPLAVIAIVAFASLVSAGILLATLVPFVFGMILAGTLARRASERQLTALGELSGLFVDRVRNLPILRHFGAEERIARQVAGATRAVAERTIEVLRAAFLSSAVLEFFSALAVALVAVYCGFHLLGLLPFRVPETLSLREAFFALAMAPEFYLPMRRLAAAYHEKQLGEAARSELAALPDPPALPPAPEGFAGLEAREAIIAWPGRTIGPVSFSIGTTGLLALTGPTGSGKTSLLSAMAGQVMLAEGAMTPVTSNAIAWAAQHPLVLPGTLGENIALAKPDADADADAIRAVADRVGLAPLLARRAEGLDLVLDHRGSGLSGGERRRLGLARALLADRPLLLCDEPTADLDAESASAIIALLQHLASERSVVVATHDPALIAVAGRVVTL